MPSSNLVLAPAILAMAAEVKPRRILDVGPGNGKYGLLVREYLPRVDRLAAVEAETRYLDAFPWLGEIYDEILGVDVVIVPAAFFADFDLVLMLDVLEHLDHDAGAELLARIPGRVIVSTPRDFFQNPEAEQGWQTERHRSVWTAAEIAEVRALEVEDVAALDSIGAVLVRTAPL